MKSLNVFSDDKICHHANDQYSKNTEQQTVQCETLNKTKYLYIFDDFFCEYVAYFCDKVSRQFFFSTLPT